MERTIMFARMAIPIAAVCLFEAHIPPSRRGGVRGRGLDVARAALIAAKKLLLSGRISRYARNRSSGRAG